MSRESLGDNTQASLLLSGVEQPHAMRCDDGVLCPSLLRNTLPSTSTTSELPEDLRKPAAREPAP